MKKQKPKRAPIIPVLAGVTTAFVIVSAAFIGFMIWLNNPFVSVGDTVVPALVGQKYDNVKLKYSDVVMEVVASDYSTEYGKGIIYDQSPKAGTKVKVNSTIKIKISTGQLTTKLQDFAGQDVVQVIARLEELGIKYDEKQVYDETVPLNGVVRTMPDAGTEVTAGEVVTLFVSLGKEVKEVPVPDLKGISLSDAKTLLDNYKLKIGEVKYDPDSEEDAGVIIGQSPTADTEVAQNTEISVTVAGSSDGPVRLTLFVPLPKDINREVEVSATQNGADVQKDTVNPSEAKVWKPVFEGEDVVEIDIFFDGELYQVYELDFERKGHRLLHDFSSEFEE